jgi:undecaprenyl-diphosphatase
MGVHYPGDILGGMIVGLIIGSLIFLLYKKVIYYHVNGFKDIAMFQDEVLIPLSGGILSISLIMLCARVFL